MKKTSQAKENIDKLSKKIVAEIKRGENPSVNVPIRSLSNITFNKVTKMIEMGLGKSKRYFFNVAHVRKFVQTLEAATTAKELIEIDKHLSLRQVFYRMKRTIP
ncbi:MAG: DNA topoisomerase VI, partial [Candidatus Aenigmarchaeota archaeon]|nr:DNA topoisomerase VI [Candidatus Aenigmarchaeota archaeon]